MYEIKPVKEVYSYFKQNKIEQKFVPLKKKKDWPKTYRKHIGKSYE